MTETKKMIAAGVLLAVWGGLVAFGKAPAAEYIIGLRDALVALGVFTAAMTNPNPRG